MNPKIRSENSDTPSRRRSKPLMTENLVGKRIADALGTRNLNWLAAETGISDSTLSGYVQSGIAKADNAVTIAKALGCSVDWLLTGKEATGGKLAQVDEDDEVVEVEEIDLAYGLGGTYADGPVEVRLHRMARSFVESITTTPAKSLTIARGLGDSMAPTLQDGDMVIIDRSQRTIREQDALWAMTIGDIAMIKRLRIRGERVTILSDNDRVPLDEAHHEEIRIVGRVIFIGRKL
ncbi:S24 family peptidase [Sphingomonas paucimobilis]|uniref:Helix-turn-helix transcriptional regulator n=2 Tax=Sphingomonas paucimobilis TaxID=13689 RepID=A0A7T3AA29_SPHPI|nr:S24 family peptidase [Sphingomonas paucimobilis]QPT08617.1 helix-turn-helix transcriptional regulator [Sphingomonas paucimobilis]